MSKTKPIIAIVDDDESVGRAISRLLRSHGMNTDTFISGDKFVKHLETVRAVHPDCVVLDVQMPGTNGLEVQEFLVRSQNPPPIVFMTGYGEANVRERALRAGAVAFLLKPFDDEALVNILIEALKRDRSEPGEGLVTS